MIAANAERRRVLFVDDCKHLQGRKQHRPPPVSICASIFSLVIRSSGNQHKWVAKSESAHVVVSRTMQPFHEKLSGGMRRGRNPPLSYGAVAADRSCTTDAVTRQNNQNPARCVKSQAGAAVSRLH